MGLYAVYALILFAVPTLGVSAIIALLAVTGRAGPEDPLAQSHFIYQQRTLWTAAVAVAATALNPDDALAYDPGPEETGAKYQPDAEDVQNFYRTNGYETLKK